MTKFRKSLFAAFLGCLVFTPARLPTMLAQEPTTNSADAKLPLKAVLVLTPEFCSTVFKQGSIWTTGRDTFEVGKIACIEMEPTLKSAYEDLTVASTPPTSGNAQVVLIPKFANAYATKSVFAFSNRELDVFLEWTIKDASGKTVWLQTVRGSSKHHMGNGFTHGRNVKLIERDAVKNVVIQSSEKMEESPELRNLVSIQASPVK